MYQFRCTLLIDEVSDPKSAPGSAYEDDDIFVVHATLPALCAWAKTQTNLRSVWDGSQWISCDRPMISLYEVEGFLLDPTSVKVVESSHADHWGDPQWEFLDILHGVEVCGEGRISKELSSLPKLKQTFGLRVVFDQKSERVRAVLPTPIKKDAIDGDENFHLWLRTLKEAAEEAKAQEMGLCRAWLPFLRAHWAGTLGCWTLGVDWKWTAVCPWRETPSGWPRGSGSEHCYKNVLKERVRWQDGTCGEVPVIWLEWEQNERWNEWMRWPNGHAAFADARKGRCFTLSSLAQWRGATLADQQTAVSQDEAVALTLFGSPP